MPHLLPARREQIILELLGLKDESLAGDHPVLVALRAVPGPWSHTLSRAVLTTLQRRMDNIVNKNQRSDWYLRSDLSEFALRIPADLVNGAVAIIPAAIREQSLFGASVMQFEKLLHFRDEMLRELREG